MLKPQSWAVLAVGLGVFAPKVERALSGAGWEATGSESLQVRETVDASTVELECTTENSMIEVGFDPPKPVETPPQAAAKPKAKPVVKRPAAKPKTEPTRSLPRLPTPPPAGRATMTLTGRSG